MPPDGDFGWTAIGAAVGALFTGLFAWIVQRIKSGADIEVAVLAQWEKLNGAISLRLSTVEKDFAEYRNKMANEIEEIHTKYNHEIDEMRKQHRAEMRELRDQNDELRRQNEGFKKQIAQNSQSTAQLLGDLKDKSK